MKTPENLQTEIDLIRDKYLNRHPVYDERGEKKRDIENINRLKKLKLYLELAKPTEGRLRDELSRAERELLQLKGSYMPKNPWSDKHYKDYLVSIRAGEKEYQIKNLKYLLSI